MNNNYLSRGFLLFSLYSLFRLANTITRFTPSQFTNLIHDTRELIIAFNRLRTRCQQLVCCTPACSTFRSGEVW